MRRRLDDFDRLAFTSMFPHNNCVHVFCKIEWMMVVLEVKNRRPFVRPSIHPSTLWDRVCVLLPLERLCIALTMSLRRQEIEI